MHSLSSAKTAITSLLFGVSAVLSNELRNAAPAIAAILPQWLTLAIATGLAVAIGQTFPYLLFKLRWARKTFEGRAWLEGYWEILTEPTRTNEPAAVRGILEYSYEGNQLELQAQAWHLYEDGSEAHSVSQIIELRPNDLQYVNIFVRSERDHQVAGVATGHFHIDKAVASHPTTYTGRLSFFNSRPAEAQRLTKLQDSLVKKYASDFGLGWKQKYLLDQSTPPSTPI